MSRGGLWLVLVSAALTVVANLALRSGVGRAGHLTWSRETVLALLGSPGVLGGFLCYGLAAITWIRVLSSEPLSTAYPLLVSLAFSLVTLGAMALFGEQVSWQKVLGLGAMLGGIILVARA